MFEKGTTRSSTAYVRSDLHFCRLCSLSYSGHFYRNV